VFSFWTWYKLKFSEVYSNTVIYVIVYLYISFDMRTVYCFVVNRDLSLSFSCCNENIPFFGVSTQAQVDGGCLYYKWFGGWIVDTSIHNCKAVRDKMQKE
jgi:hypothetical protein